MQDILRLLIRERRCAACHEPFVPEQAEETCPPCAARLQPRTGGYCPSCGELASWPSLPPSPCGQCLSKPPPWNGFAFFAAHDGLLHTDGDRLVLTDRGRLLADAVVRSLLG